MAAPTSELAIETHGLTKRFRSQVAVDGIDLAVPRGSVFGFLGPNGSGKTTTIRMLLGLVAPNAGDARVLGAAMPRHVDSVLPRVGALVEGPAFSPYLSGAANLRRFDAADRHAPRRSRDHRVAEALDRVGLSHAARKRVHAYSLGMKQRLGIANALLMRRELLVLDEPTNGLDPQGTREVRALIRSFADDGTTVFVSSHLLAEVEQVCTHVGVMSAGRLVAQGTLDDFRDEGEARVRVRTADVAAAREVLARVLGEGAVDAEVDGRADTDVAADTGAAAGAVTARLGGTAPEAVVAALVGAGVRVRGFETVHASLEQRFVELTGEGFDVVQ
ncbi:ABC transporter ATP-binding protein [Agromyces sp. NPDC057865]|uniref:ABC transporter ATP-binding protein n=1 Tax=Agromyces sp. NPDC057865 TaxID=3346267 RepID=UPI00367249BF